MFYSLTFGHAFRFPKSQKVKKFMDASGRISHACKIIFQHRQQIMFGHCNTCTHDIVQFGVVTLLYLVPCAKSCIQHTRERLSTPLGRGKTPSTNELLSVA